MAVPFMVIASVSTTSNNYNCGTAELLEKHCQQSIVELIIWLMQNISFPMLAIAALALAPVSRGADLLDRLGIGKSKTTNATTPAAIGATLTPDQMIGGLKEALAKGVEKAVANLGKEDGFLKDVGVKIPMPESLQKVEKTLRTLRQDKLADDFVTTMNRAAERATPEAAVVLGDAIKQMTVADARAILTGTNNAATQYFRRTSETNLFARFHPIVQKATEQAGVTSAYKAMMGKVRFAGSFLPVDAADLDAYVTRKALDGLFLKIAEQEKMIRENPVARTTDLLQKVFGAFGK